MKGYGGVYYRIRKGSPLEAGLGSNRVDRLTTDDVVAYVEKRRRARRSKATVNRDLELLGAALRLALQKGQIVRMPSTPAKRSEKNNISKTFFEKSELDAPLPDLSQ